MGVKVLKFEDRASLTVLNASGLMELQANGAGTDCLQ